MRYLFHRKFFKIVSSNTNFYSTPYTIINLIPSKNCPRVLYSLVAKLPFSPYLHLAQNFDHSMIFLCLCVYDNLLRPQFMQYFFFFGGNVMFFCVIVFERTISKDFNKAMSRFTRARLSSRKKLIHFCHIFPYSTALE